MRALGRPLFSFGLRSTHDINNQDLTPSATVRYYPAVLPGCLSPRMREVQNSAIPDFFMIHLPFWVPFRSCFRYSAACGGIGTMLSGMSVAI